MTHTDYIVKTLGSQVMIITQLQAACDTLQTERDALKSELDSLRAQIAAQRDAPGVGAAKEAADRQG